MITCSLHHTSTGACSGNHDLGAVVGAAYAAAIDADRNEAARNLARFDALSAEGVTTQDGAAKAAAEVRNWLTAGLSR